MISRDITKQREEEVEERKYYSYHSPAYSSRFMTKGLPKHSLHEKSASPDEAFQIVSDCLTLDRNPTLNMATFVTSWIENQGENLMRKTQIKNAADLIQYPQIEDIQNRCLSILSNLFNSRKEDKAIGVSTIGSSEAIMLACLSFKFNWKDRMKKKGKPTDKPNIIFGKNAHVSIEKFARFFEVEARMVSVSEESNYCLSAEKAMEMVDENTIGIVGILGSTFTGHFEPIEDLNNAIEKLYNEKGLYVPIHVDAASGGFIAPFCFPDYVWDFRLKWVKSINVSSHKYGLVPPGLGWCIWRDKEQLNNNLIFHLNYLGGDTETCSINFSKSSANIFAQYYNFVRLGKEGYRRIISNCLENADYLVKKLNSSRYFKVLSEQKKERIPLVAFRLSDEVKSAGNIIFDEFDLSHNLLKKGWQVPAYTLPPNCNETVIMRVVIREMHSEDLMEKLFNDLMWAIDDLKSTYSKLKGEKRLPSKRHRSFSVVC